MAAGRQRQARQLRLSPFGSARAQSCDVIPEDNRFESDPAEALPDDPGLPAGWEAGAVDGDDPAQVERLTELLRGPRARRTRLGERLGVDDVLVEVSARSARSARTSSSATTPA